MVLSVVKSIVLLIKNIEAFFTEVQAAYWIIQKNIGCCVRKVEEGTLCGRGSSFLAIDLIVAYSMLPGT